MAYFIYQSDLHMSSGSSSMLCPPSRSINIKTNASLLLLGILSRSSSSGSFEWRVSERVLAAGQDMNQRFEVKQVSYAHTGKNAISDALLALCSTLPVILAQHADGTRLLDSIK